MRLERHINRLIDTLYSRRDLKVEELVSRIQADYGQGSIAARVRYPDGSLLEFNEFFIVERGWVLNKISYAYHYQESDGTLVIRYDNTPDHPEIATTFPHHKHVGKKVEAAAAPDLHRVLQEIDRLIGTRRAAS